MFISCNRNIDVISCELATIIYPTKDLFKIKNNDWIEIDGLKITHKNNFKEINTKNKMPSYEFISFKIKNKELIEKKNTIDMGMHLYKVLKNSNNYIFYNEAQTLINGNVSFSRKDKENIIIKYKKKYPIKLSTSNKSTF